jgi:polyketide synthase 12
VGNAEELWELVEAGRDAISAFPEDRGWDAASSGHPAAPYVRLGGFVADAAGFDPGFFRISPREALAMDPQQRLLLEVSWEAFERAGIDPASLRGSLTGVFAGAWSQRYDSLLAAGPGQGAMPTSDAGSVISGRVAYAFGLEGPAMTVDTACSSSLVAVHLAGQALRSGECDLALAGGVTVFATPVAFGFGQQLGLSADGRCKAFSDAADGMGMAEGAGMLLLERLSDARRNGHQVLAVIMGSAVNQDGASNGLTAPNGPSQQRVIRAALASAGVSADQVDVVEAHGSGTVLGDPIEAQALLATYGQGRPQDRPVLLGSVKSNIGHTQAAAGVAGVIKMVLALRHQMLPRTLHVAAPSRHVDWSSGAARLLTEPVPWPADGRARRAGVSSFGISGTNAHVILEEAAAADAAVADGGETAGGGQVLVPGPVTAWLVSGRSADGLAGQAARLAEFAVARPELGVADVAWSLATTRSLAEHRAVVVGGSGPELVAGLSAVAGGSPAAGAVSGVAGSTGQSVFVFPGQGSQWAGMGRELAASSPAFAARLAECGRALARYVDWSLEEVIAEGSELDRDDVVQPVLWAVMVSLAAVWQAAGVTPDAVVGHSQGEIAAACVAGILSLEDGARIVALRSRALRKLAGRGGMCAVAESADRVRERIAEFGELLAVAAVNSPSATVVSGEPSALEALADACAADGVRARVLPVDYASHSRQVEELREEILALLSGITPGAAQVPMISTATGEQVAGPELDAGYWYESLRSPVEFHPAVRALAATGHRLFIEVSPHPVLAAAIAETLEDAAGGTETLPAAVAGTLRRDDGGVERLLMSLAAAFVRGAPVDWAAVLGGGRRVDLPTYAFQRQRYWPSPSRTTGDVTAAGLGAVDHPLLGAAVELPSTGALVLTGRLSAAAQPWLADHVITGVNIVPGTAFIELAAEAAEAVECGLVEELTLQVPLMLPVSGAVQVQVMVLAAGEDGRREVQVYSRPDGPVEASWTMHAAGTLAPAGRGWLAPDGDRAAGPWTPAQWPPEGAEPVAVDGLYAQLSEGGYDYGPAFQGVRAAWRAGDDVYTEVLLPDEAGEGAGFTIHPALFDALLHGALIGEKTRGVSVGLPFSWSGVRLGRGGGSRARVRISPVSESSVRLDAAGEDGEPLVGVTELVFRPVDQSQLEGARRGDHGSLYQIEWVPVAADAAVPQGRVAVLGELPGAPAEWSRFTDLLALEQSAADGTGVPETVVAAVEPGGTASAGAAAGKMLDLLQRWLASEYLADTRLAVVTRNAVAVGDEEPDLAQASVWGLVRSAQCEHPGRFALADIDDGEPRNWAALAGAEEPQLAVRSGLLLAPRLARAVIPSTGRAWGLGSERTGTLEGLAILPSGGERPLDAHEVRVGVRAAGLNFRDVMIALGMRPGEALLGSEAAGVVLEVGAAVTDLSPGDRVMGLVAEAFGPVAVADRQMIVPMPADFSFVQAAAVPVAYLTAYYGLADLAGLRRGERLLVHAAAGGVGMAAVQLARHWGAEVFGTASEPKREAVLGLGLPEERIGSSRDLSFREKFLDATDGEGVDVVLNALASDFIDASLDLLPRGGRFIEMGKTGIRDPEAIAGERPGVRYRAFSLEDAGPARIQQMLRDVMSLFAQGVLRHSPVRSWNVRRGADAFRFLREGRNVGKVVLTIPPRLDPAGTVLVTGGTGGLGALVARHLAARHGVRHLLLVSRRGPAAEETAKLVSELAGLGAQVQVEACDVADRDQLAALLGSLKCPLTAVVHAAGVLDDGMVESLEPGQLERVLRPKADAALHLHELTTGMELSAFVLFSSAAGLIGSPGQGNYAAANAFLDALAAARWANGLPAVSLAWGLWADDTGLTGGLGEAGRARFTRMGVAAIPGDLGLEMFDQALGLGEPLVVPVLLDRLQLRAQARAGLLPVLLHGLVRMQDRPGGAGRSLAQQLSGIPQADWESVILGLVRAHTAAVLGHASAEAVDPGRPFTELGFDSLAAVELRNRLAQATGLPLPSTLAFDHPNALAVTTYLLAKVSDRATAESPIDQQLEELEAWITTLEDGEKERAAKRLRQLLNAITSNSEQRTSDRIKDATTLDAILELLDGEFGESATSL